MGSGIAADGAGMENLEDLNGLLITGNAQEEAQPVEQLEPTIGEVSPPPTEGEREGEGGRGIPYSNGEAVYDLVARNSVGALQFLLSRIRWCAWKVPPFDATEKDSAALEHLWDVILKKTGNDTRREIVFEATLAGKFDFVPYEVKNRLIDDARKASAQKRGGDGDHLPRFDSLTFDGEPGRDGHGEEFDSPAGGAQRQRPKGGRIERKTNDTWQQFTENIRRKELASDPRVEELGRAARLYRFYLEHEDEGRTDTDVAQRLGVTDRTIRNYRQKLIRFMKQCF